MDLDSVLMQGSMAQSEIDLTRADTITLGSANVTNVTGAVGSSFSLGSYDMGASLTSSITAGSAVSGTIYNGGFTINSGANVPWMTTSPASPASAKISLSGEDADVEVNGWSLVAAVKRIEERLAIMQPNPELESEWSELKQLGDQYRKLEQHIRDKQATWDRLKAMPAPEIG